MRSIAAVVLFKRVQDSWSCNSAKVMSYTNSPALIRQETRLPFKRTWLRTEDAEDCSAKQKQTQKLSHFRSTIENVVQMQGDVAIYTQLLG